MGSYIGTSRTMHNTVTLLEAARRTGVATILWGRPGSGKTALIRALAEREQLPLKVLIGSTMDPTDVDGLPALRDIELADGSHAVVTENTLPVWAEQLMDAKGGILFLDELSTAPPSVQAAMLSLLQSRRVGQHYLPETVWIIAAANDAKDAADGWTLAPPMANRLMHIDYVLEKEDWFEGMLQAWGREEVTARELEERVKVVSFLKRYPSLLEGMPADPESAGKAWPSYRTWDKLSDVLAHVDDRSARILAMRGLVGEEATVQYDKWERELNLPAHEDLLAHPDSFDWSAFKADQVWVILNMVLGRMTHDNVEASARVFEVANRQGQYADVCASLAVPLIERVQKVAGPKEAGRVVVNTLKSYSEYLKKAEVL